MKPSTPELFVENIPAELKQSRRWIGWRYDYRDGKWGKRPVSCGSGKVVDVTKAGSWGTFDEAVRAVEYHTLDGVGFVFHDDDGHTGIDLDDCRDPTTGRLFPWADRIIQELDSYTEVSPSGAGVHIIVKGQKPSGVRSRQGNIEVYSQGRYFTVTGQWVDGTPMGPEDRQVAVEAIVKRLSRADEDIIKLASQAVNGGKFGRLWDGDWLAYDSESEADLALCGMLAYWTDGHTRRIEELFGQSALGRREKWLSRPDYRESTIRKAVQGQADMLLTSGTKNNQITRSNQENTVSKHAAPPEVAASPSMKERQEKAVQLALDLADERGTAPVWETSFELARRLRTLSDDYPEQYEAAVQAFCERTGQDLEEFWYAFNASWPKVRMAEGDDILSWAFKIATAEPYTLTSCLGPAHGRIASMAWHLSQHTRPDPFFLPIKRLSGLLGVNFMTISRVIDLLEGARVIECVDENYSFRGKTRKAKEFRFSGPSPK